MLRTLILLVIFVCVSAATAMTGFARARDGAERSVGSVSGIPPVSQRIGAAGGHLTAVDESGAVIVSLHVPAGALPVETEITIEEMRPSDGLLATSNAGIMLTPLGRFFEIGPSGTVFEEPVRLVFHYDATGLGDRATEALRIATAVGRTWQALNDLAVDPVAMTISGTTTHLSPFGVALSPGQYDELTHARLLYVLGLSANQLDCNDPTYPNDCDALELPETESFPDHAAPKWTLNALYLRLRAQEEGIDLGGQPILSLDETTDCSQKPTLNARCYIKAMVPRINNFLRYGFDMKPGWVGTCSGGTLDGQSCSDSHRDPCESAGGTCAPDDYTHEDGYPNKCSQRPDGCEFSGGVYQGSAAENAVQLAVEMYRRWGTGWNDPELRMDFRTLLRNAGGYMRGKDIDLWYNQYSAAAPAQVAGGELLCEESVWDDGVDTQNDRLRLMERGGPYEANAVHYGYHNIANVWPLLNVAEPTMRNQAQVAVDALSVWYSAFIGYRGLLGWVHSRGVSKFWCEVDCNRATWPALATMFGIDVHISDEELMQAAHGYMPSMLDLTPPTLDRAIRQLVFEGHVEAWQRDWHNPGISGMPRSRWDMENIRNTFPIQSYWTENREAVLSVAHGRAHYDAGPHFGANLYHPDAINGQVLAVHFEGLAANTQRDSGQLWGPPDPLSDTRAGYDYENFFVSGPKGMGGIRLIEPRARPCQHYNGGYCSDDSLDCEEADGSDCLARTAPRTYLYRDKAFAAGEVLGGYTCDADPTISCTAGVDGEDPVACAGLPQKSCNNWRSMQVGNSLLAVRMLGPVCVDDSPERGSELQASSLTKVCAPGACPPIPDYYDRLVSCDDSPAGSLWWLSDTTQFTDLAEFSSFIGSRHFRWDVQPGSHTKFPYPRTSPQGYPVAEFDVVRGDDGSDMRIYLDFWPDPMEVHGPRRVCTAAEGYPSCASPVTVDETERAGEFSLNQGFARTYHPGSRTSPLVDWDFDNGRLIVERNGTDLIIDMTDAWVDPATSSLPAVTESPDCAGPRDEIAPSVPGSPGIFSLGSAMILSWTESSDDDLVAGYRIYRDDEGEVGTSTTSPHIDIANLIESTTYTYTIRAEDAAGNLSDESVSVQATTPPEFIGPTAVQLSGQAIGSTIHLSWPIHAYDASGLNSYQIYRDGVFQAFSSPVNKYWDDTAVTSGATYTYTVTSWDIYGNGSPASNPVTVTAN